MSARYHDILVIQTAFIGDVVLALPMLQELRRVHPEARIDVVVVPRAADLLRNHPAITTAIVYDKRGSEQGIGGFFRLRSRLKANAYDLAVIPHRSIRSALLARMAGIPQRLGFSTSAGRFLMTETVDYRNDLHEIERNISLLRPLGIAPAAKVLPDLYPSDEDCWKVDALFREFGFSPDERPVAIAPGTIWNTKQWPKERFAHLARLLLRSGHRVVLVGGGEDAPLCNDIIRLSGVSGIRSAAGGLGLLASAELLRRCAVLVSNDSAPMHLAVAMRTPVAAIFGATVPAFGFAPYGEADVVIETTGLTCRPCGIHGGKECPIRTFDCMVRIAPERVFDQVQRLVSQSPG